MRFKYEMQKNKNIAYVDVNKVYFIQNVEDEMEFMTGLTNILQQIWQENGGYMDLEE